MPHLRHLSFSIALLILLPATAQTRKEQIAALQATADSLSTELLRSRERAQDDERARSALLHRLDTLQQGRARDAANHLKREQRLQQDLDLANNALQQARDELAADMASVPDGCYLPLKKEIVAVVTDVEAAKKVLSVVDSLMNLNLVQPRNMDIAEGESWDDHIIFFQYHSQQFLFLQLHVYHFQGPARDGSTFQTLAFRKASGHRVPLEELLLTERRTQLAALLQQQVRAMIPEVTECLGEQPDGLADWSASDRDLFSFSFGPDGVAFGAYLLQHHDQDCEPGLRLDKREVAPFFVQGVWD